MAKRGTINGNSHFQRSDNEAKKNKIPMNKEEIRQINQDVSKIADPK